MNIEQNSLEEDFRKIYENIADKRRKALLLRDEMVFISEENGIPFVDLDGSVYKPAVYERALSKFSTLDQYLIADILECSVYKLKYGDDDARSGWSQSNICW
jgi:hypothetical protein